MVDPLEITRNPGGDFRCSAHEDMLRATMDLKGDVKEMRATVQAVDAKVDTMSLTMRAGFTDVKEQLRSMSVDRSSDIKGLKTRIEDQAGKINNLATVSASRSGGITTLSTLIPWALTGIAVITAVLVAIFG